MKTVSAEVTGSGMPRVARVALGHERVGSLIERLLAVATEGLPRMFDGKAREFVFRRRRCADGTTISEGTSLRYAAVAVLGARHLAPATQQRMFGDETAAEFCLRLLDRSESTPDLGALALVAWAAGALGLPETKTVLARMQRQDAAVCPTTTVEAAWVLSALVAMQQQVDTQRLAAEAQKRLLRVSGGQTGLFPHWTDASLAPWIRSHVACFADQVYSIQALARYHQALGSDAALEAAEGCASRICELQGEGGQWWWHYDVRTGAVIEGYPVYTVHQDAMGPMALLDLQDACGSDHSGAVRRGLKWMETAEEVGTCLVDEREQLIWRSVKRSDPAKIVRRVRAALTRALPGRRAKWLDRWFAPRAVDYEDRPYHLGWILDAWLGGLK